MGNKGFKRKMEIMGFNEFPITRFMKWETSEEELRNRISKELMALDGITEVIFKNRDIQVIIESGKYPDQEMIQGIIFGELSKQDIDPINYEIFEVTGKFYDLRVIRIKWIQP